MLWLGYKVHLTETCDEDTPHLIASMETFDLWMAFFRDSEGNLLGIMCEIHKGNGR